MFRTGIARVTEPWLKQSYAIGELIVSHLYSNVFKAWRPNPNARWRETAR